MTHRMNEQDLNLPQYDEAGTDLEESTMRMWAMAYELPQLMRKAEWRDLVVQRATLKETAHMILAALETKQ